METKFLTLKSGIVAVSCAQLVQQREPNLEFIETKRNHKGYIQRPTVKHKASSVAFHEGQWTRKTNNRMSGC